MTNTICSHSMVQYGTVQNTLCLHLYCTWADLAKNSISRHELTTYKISDFIFTSPHHNYLGWNQVTRCKKPVLYRVMSVSSCIADIHTCKETHKWLLENRCLVFTKTNTVHTTIPYRTVLYLYSARIPGPVQQGVVQLGPGFLTLHFFLCTMLCGTVLKRHVQMHY